MLNFRGVIPSREKTDISQQNRNLLFQGVIFRSELLVSASDFCQVLLAHLKANDLPSAEAWLEQMLGPGHQDLGKTSPLEMRFPLIYLTLSFP